MGKRAVLVALSFAVVVALAGCVGIPTSGGVVAGPPITTTGTGGFIPLANGPQPGAAQEEILQDFITAANSPANDYAIAKLFLTATLKNTWHPDNGVVIRTGATTISRVTDDALHYTATVTAKVDETGVYSEFAQSASQMRSYSFTKVGGEWRISAAPDGIVLSQNSFDGVFDEHPLYFFDPTYRFLVPDVRWFPSRSTTPDRIVRSLLSGPTVWLQSGVVLSEFPSATTLAKSVDIRSGTATVDLSSEATVSDQTQRDRMRQQLAATLGTLTGLVSTVVITVGGIALQLPDTSSTVAVQNPTVESSPLIEFTKDGASPVFGFAGATGGVASIAGISDRVVTLGALGVSLSSDKRAAAVLSPAGVSIVIAGNATPVLVDARPQLIVPSIDSLGFVWSAQASSASSLTTFGFDGVQHAIASNLPVDARIASAKVSRDGTRILLYFQTNVGARLVVAGIIRASGVPTSLGQLYDLPVSAGSAIDAAWVDSRTVAAMYGVGASTLVTALELGGPSAPLGDTGSGVTIVGGNGRADGIRVLSSGAILQTQGSGGWQPTGISASLLATQQ